MDMLAGIFGVAAQVAALYLLADFASGVFRRAEDRLGSGKAPFRGPVFAAPNALHHREPPAMIDLPWWRNNRDIMIAAVSVVMLFRLAGALTWQVLVCAAAGGFARQAHCLAQTPAARLPRPARWFQRGSLLRDGQHHRAPHRTRDCTLTHRVNPAVDWLGIWRRRARIFVPLFGAPRRDDLRGEPWYRDRPAWA